MSTYRVILNPAAGRGRSGQSKALVEATLREAGVSFDFVETSGPGDAARLAAEAAQVADVVVSMGGDGTAHETIQGLIQAAQGSGAWAAGRPAGALGIIPVGTGNDYAWRLGLPENDPQAACRLLLADQRRVVDLGQVTDERGQTAIFANHLGGGFEAAANIESRRIRHLRGMLLYLAAVLRVLPQYRRGRTVTIRHDDRQETRPILLASVANGGRSGGGFKMAPQAQLDDGRLDLVLADSPNTAIILWLLMHVMRGTHGSQTKYVAMRRITQVTIEAPAGLPVHLDGEIFRDDARRIEVTVLPGRLQVITGSSTRPS